MPHGGEVGESQVVIDDHRHCKQQHVNNNNRSPLEIVNNNKQVTVRNGSQLVY